MKRNIKYTSTFLLLSIIIAVAACKKDAINKEELFVYAPAGKTSFDTWTANYVITRNQLFSKSSAGFPVLLTRPYTSDVQVSASIDTSLIAVYDSLNNTVSPSLPAGAFGLTGSGTVTIKAGKTASADSITVGITDNSKIDFSKKYVVPVVLKSPGNDVPVSNNRQTMFVNVSFLKINASISAFPDGNTVPVTINRTPSGDVIVPGIAAFRATVNITFPDNLDINILQDNSLIEAYNTANNTACVPFPADAYTLLQQKVSIPANTTVSKDSFKVQVSKPAAFEPGKTYILPLKIKDEGPVAPNENSQVVYIPLTVKLQNIDPSNSTVTGTQVDRTGWTATASSIDNNYSNSSPAFVFDNDYATGWQSELFAGGQPDFKLDMSGTQTIKGFSFTPMYWDFFGTPYISSTTNIAVYSSMDGINWTAQGDYTGTAAEGTTDKPALRSIKFYQPVQARYFKFIILEYSGFAAGFGELNAFE